MGEPPEAPERASTEGIELFQAALDLPEMRNQARHAGVDTVRLKAAIPHLTDAELADIARRADGLADVTAGSRQATGRSRSPRVPDP